MVKQAMKERPILFSAPMVQAILEGRKTMTRRIITDEIALAWMLPAGFSKEFIALPENHLCRYGYAGDRLWVKEKWRVGAWDVDSGRIAVDYAASPDLGKTPWRDVEDENLWERLWVDSSDDAERAGLSLGEDDSYHWEPGRGPCRWRPSIFMPRAFSRITLEIVNVRVERLQDIIEEDALCEGIQEKNVIGGATCAGGMHQEITEPRYFFDGCDEEGFDDAVSAYRSLWESINGSGSWDANPWVWVIEFKVVKA